MRVNRSVRMFCGALCAIVAGAVLVGGGAAWADPVPYSVTGTIHLPGTPIFLAADSGLHTVYATDGQSVVSVVDAAAGNATHSIEVGYGYGVAVNASTHTAYVASYNNAEVAVIDEVANMVTATIPVRGAPIDVAVDPSLHRVYVTSLPDTTTCPGPVICPSTVSVIDASTNSVTAVIPVGRGGSSIAVDPGTHTAYVSNSSDNTVSVIDEASNTVTHTIAVPAPADVAVDPVSHTVFVGSRANDKVKVVDEATNAISRTISLSGPPGSIAVDGPAHTLYVVTGNFSVSVIDETLGAVIDTVPLGATGVALGIAVDTSTHTAYVGHAYGRHGHRLDVITQAVKTNVTAVSPQSGPTTGGQLVTISGDHFTGATRVVFGRVPATSFQVDSDTTITATAPAHSAGYAHVRVRTGAGGLSAQRPENRYTYLA